MISKERSKVIIITRDNIRSLKIHLDHAIPKIPVLLSSHELELVKLAGISLDRTEQTGDRIKVLEAAKLRKENMLLFDSKRAKKSEMSELDQETLEKSNHLLAKMEEQEDDVKHLNELLLYAKCVTIRDNQVKQNKLIAKQKKSEELRLDAIMEKDRVEALEKQENEELARISERRKGAAKIRQQIEERRENALLKQELKDQETKQILKQMAENIAEDKREKAAKTEAQIKLMKIVTVANAASLTLKGQHRQAEKDEDKKVLQYIIDKEKKEEANDLLALQKKADREVELSRLRATQEKMADKQAEQDAVRAQRAYESHEREWRKKEKEGAEKKATSEKDIMNERLAQRQAHLCAKAAESKRLMDDFNVSLFKQKELELKIKADDQKKHDRNRLYAVDVKAQITEKEVARRNARDEFFLDGVRSSRERQEKKTKINTIKQRKIAELRDMGVASKYCDEVQRQSFQ